MEVKVAKPEYYWRQRTAQGTDQRGQGIIKPSAIAPRKTEAEKLKELERLAEKGKDSLIAKAVHRHNEKVVANSPRAEQVETAPDEPPKKNRTRSEVIADAVNRINKERERRGYFRPERGK